MHPACQVCDAEDSRKGAAFLAKEGRLLLPWIS